jgi:hypothetical protein
MAMSKMPRERSQRLFIGAMNVGSSVQKVSFDDYTTSQSPHENQGKECRS